MANKSFIKTLFKFKVSVSILTPSSRITYKLDWTMEYLVSLLRYETKIVKKKNLTAFNN